MRLPDTPAIAGIAVVEDEAAARQNGAGLLLLRDEQDCLALQNLEGNEKPVSVSFSDGRMGWRLSAERFRHELVIKALSSSKPLQVVDATAGLGRDAAIMAGAGHHVLMLEQNPVLAQMLADGLQRLEKVDAELAVRLQLQHGDARELLPELPSRPDAILLDPMFPPRQKSAAIKKDLRLLQLLLGEGVSGHSDASQASDLALLETARRTALKKVLVKRPAKAPVLAGVPAHHCISGKAVRFDVYLPL